MTFLEIQKSLYCQGEPKIGSRLFPYDEGGMTCITVKPYEVALVDGKYFLIKAIEPEKFLQRYFKDNQYFYVYKQGNSILTKNEDGVVMRDNWIRKGQPVATLDGRKGTVIEFAKSFAAIRFDSKEEVVEINNLLPAEEYRSTLEIISEALKNYEIALPIIKANMSEDFVNRKRKFFGNLYKSMESEELKNINNNLKPPKTGVFSGIKNYFKDAATNISNYFKPAKVANSPSSTVKINPISTSQPNTSSIGMGKSPLLLKQKNPMALHKLVHIDLNPNSTGAGDKYMFHYQKFPDPKSHTAYSQFSSTKYLDPSGKEVHPDKMKNDKVFSGNKIFLPGEKILHNDKELTVASHIDPNPTPQGYVNYGNLLAKDKTGKFYSVPRKEADLVGSNFEKAQKIQLADGTFKFPHSISAGDKLKFGDSVHNVIASDPYHGILSVDPKTGKFFGHHSSDFDKPYLHKLIQQVPEKGATVKVNIGGKKYTGTVHANKVSNEPNVAYINIAKPGSQEKQLIKVKYSDILEHTPPPMEKHTEQNPNPFVSQDVPDAEQRINDFVKSKTASVPLMMTGKMREQLKNLGYPEDAIKEMKPQKAHDVINGKVKYNQEFLDHHDKMDKLFGAGEQVDTGESLHKLGIGDYGLRSKVMPDGKIKVMPESKDKIFSFGKKSDDGRSQYNHVIEHVDLDHKNPEGDTDPLIKYREAGKEKIKELPLSQYKKIVSEVEMLNKKAEPKAPEQKKTEEKKVKVEQPKPKAEEKVTVEGRQATIKKEAFGRMKATFDNGESAYVEKNDKGEYSVKKKKEKTVALPEAEAYKGRPHKIEFKPGEHHEHLKGIRPENMVHFFTGKNKIYNIVPAEQKLLYQAIASKKKMMSPKISDVERKAHNTVYSSYLDKIARQKNISREEAGKYMDEEEAKLKDFLMKHRKEDVDVLVNHFADENGMKKSFLSTLMGLFNPFKEERKEVASIAVSNQEKLLMGKRRDNGKWTLPGGHLEFGETPQQAAVRELFEETGILASADDMIYLGKENITTQKGEPYTIHSFWLNQKSATSCKFDPDAEVAQWHYIDMLGGLPDAVTDNLHSPKNVTLKLMGLQDAQYSQLYHEINGIAIY